MPFDRGMLDQQRHSEVPKAPPQANSAAAFGQSASRTLQWPIEGPVSNWQGSKSQNVQAKLPRPWEEGDDGTDFFADSPTLGSQRPGQDSSLPSVPPHSAAATDELSQGPNGRSTAPTGHAPAFQNGALDEAEQPSPFAAQDLQTERLPWEEDQQAHSLWI